MATYEVYADNRRAKKTVTCRGDLDSTGVFYYDGAREIAEYNSAETNGALTQVYVWGTQYVDGLRTIRRCLHVPRLPRPSALPWRQVCPIPRVIDSRCHKTGLYRLLSC